MEVEKVLKRVEDLFFFFFFFCFSLLKMTKICFGCNKMGIFYQEKTFHTGKKIRKNDFAPSEKYACYAPDEKVGEKLVTKHLFLTRNGSKLFFYLLQKKNT